VVQSRASKAPNRVAVSVMAKKSYQMFMVWMLVAVLTVAGSSEAGETHEKCQLIQGQSLLQTEKVVRVQGEVRVAEKQELESLCSEFRMNIDPRVRIAKLSTTPPVMMSLLNGNLAQSEWAYKNLMFLERPLGQIIDWVMKFEQKPVVFLDVGANVGGASLIAASHGARVVSFEPVPLHREKIFQSVCLNKFEVDPRVVPLGVSDEIASLRVTNFDEATTLRKDISYQDCVEFNKQSHLVKDHKGHPEGNCDIVIKTTTLDTALSDEELAMTAFAKFDIEGFEARALTGATKLLKSPRFRLFHFEYQPHLMEQAGTNPAVQIFDFIKEHGFDCVQENEFVQGMDQLQTLKPLVEPPSVVVKDNYVCWRNM
jgi:FkbM family methyltransferase